jgi:hypothetical protein
MNLVPYVWAGLVGGVLMGFASEIGFRLKLFQLGLITADGAFAAKMLGLKTAPKVIYGLGIPIHLATGVVFGLGYGILCLVFALDPQVLSTLVIYTFFLWLSMLFIALPIAGQGVMGQRAGRRVWWEQLMVHIMFGAGFWWGL